MPIFTKVADPDGANPDDGKWVEVGANEGGEPGLPGLGGWATITGVTGTYKKPRYEYNDGPNGVGGTDWVAYEFTDDGTLTTSGGLMDTWLVSGGTGASTNGGYEGPGGGGAIVQGIQVHQSGDLPVVVGYGGVTTGSIYQCWGGRSSIGTLTTGIGGLVSGQGGENVPGGSGKPGEYLQMTAPVVSSITGSEREYSAGSGGDAWPANQPNSGNGCNKSQSKAEDGVVIVRVPKAYADGVAENFHGWESLALVNDGVVTEVTKVPDNEPRTLDTEWVPCSADVQVGWDLVDGEFVSPPAQASGFGGIVYVTMREL